MAEAPHFLLHPLQRPDIVLLLLENQLPGGGFFPLPFLLAHIVEDEQRREHQQKGHGHAAVAAQPTDREKRSQPHGQNRISAQADHAPFPDTPVVHPPAVHIPHLHFIQEKQKQPKDSWSQHIIREQVPSALILDAQRQGPVRQQDKTEHHGKVHNDSLEHHDVPAQPEPLPEKQNDTE